MGGYFRNPCGKTAAKCPRGTIHPGRSNFRLGRRVVRGTRAKLAERQLYALFKGLLAEVWRGRSPRSVSELFTILLLTSMVIRQQRLALNDHCRRLEHDSEVMSRVVGPEEKMSDLMFKGGSLGDVFEVYNPRILGLRNSMGEMGEDPALFRNKFVSLKELYRRF